MLARFTAPFVLLFGKPVFETSVLSGTDLSSTRAGSTGGGADCPWQPGAGCPEPSGKPLLGEMCIWLLWRQRGVNEVTSRSLSPALFSMNLSKHDQGLWCVTSFVSIPLLLVPESGASQS